MKETVKKASEIIFANEGGYSSVNADDNGAVSVGRIQWHGNRALSLLKKICTALGETRAVAALGKSLFTEITVQSSWSTRTVNASEASALVALLSTDVSKAVQDEQTEADVTSYIVHVANLGVEEENAQIFMADIENQGGAGASARIIKAAEGKDLDSLYLAAKSDRVFSRHKPRRDRVYTKLTGHAFGEEAYDGILYEVRYGDTLSKIGARFGIAWREIAELNNIAEPNKIRTGQLLKIPHKATEEKPDANPSPTPDISAQESKKETTYVVERGNTLSGIGAKIGVSWKEIAKLNGITSPYTIYVGQSLLVPTEEKEEPVALAPITHTVARGDTLSAIARKYGSDVGAIVEANTAKYPKLTRNYIQAGWTLAIPREVT